MPLDPLGNSSDFVTEIISYGGGICAFGSLTDLQIPSALYGICGNGTTWTIPLAFNAPIYKAVANPDNGTMYTIDVNNMLYTIANGTITESSDYTLALALYTWSYEPTKTNAKINCNFNVFMTHNRLEDIWGS